MAGAEVGVAAGSGSGDSPHAADKNMSKPTASCNSERNVLLIVIPDP